MINFLAKNVEKRVDSYFDINYFLFEVYCNTDSYGKYLIGYIAARSHPDNDSWFLTDFIALPDKYKQKFRLKLLEQEIICGDAVYEDFEFKQIAAVFTVEIVMSDILQGLVETKF